MLPIFLKLFSSSKAPPDDQELLRLYRDTGESEHLGELFQRYSKMVYLICLKHLRDKEESKDATMQFFEQIAKTLQQHEVSNLKNWMYAAASNHCLMMLRSQKNRKSVAIEDTLQLFMENPEPMHLTDAEQVEIKETSLRQAIKELPPEQRQCIELFYLQQISYKEISALTGCDLNKVKSHIQNGKRNLKLYLEKQHEPR